MSTTPAAQGIGPDNWTKALGLELTLVTPERVEARLDADERHQQPYGILHGGVYCSIVEAVASHGAGQAALAAGQRGVVGVSNHTDFLRSHSRGELHVVATPVYVGRSVQLWSVDITRGDGKRVSSGQVRFAVLERLPGER
jgi:uncharacterized protein (TIGR00369 family)